MIHTQVKDEEALALFMEGLQDLTILFPLCGYSYLGEAVEVRESLTIETMETDGRTVWYAPSWMRLKGRKDRTWDTLHEWLHIFLNHCARFGSRNHELAGIAADVVVVRECLRILGPHGYTVPTDGVQVPGWAGDLSFEEIYDELNKGAQVKKGKGKGIPDSTDIRWEQAKQRTEADEQVFHAQFQQELAQAATVMAHTNQRMPDSIQERLDQILREHLPWGRLLRGALVDKFGNDRLTYSPPNRRFLGWKMPWGKPYIVPSRRSLKERLLVLAIDVSASVGQPLLRTFASNVGPAAARAKHTVLISFDSQIREQIKTRSPAKLIREMKLKSGNHVCTDVRPVFDVIDELNPSAVCILTDAHLYYPERRYPDTLWVTPTNAGTPPWGRVFRMEESW